MEDKNNVMTSEKAPQIENQKLLERFRKLSSECKFSPESVCEKFLNKDAIKNYTERNKNTIYQKSNLSTCSFSQL